MSNKIVPGVRTNIVDRSFTVNGSGIVAGGIVVSAKRGTLDLNVLTSVDQLIQQYGVPTSDNPSLYAALRFLRRAGILTVKRVTNDATAASGELIEATDPHLTVTAENPGAWGNNIVVSFAEIVGSTDSFSLIVSYDGAEVERFEVSRDPDAKNGFGKNIFIEDAVNERSQFITVEDNPAVTVDYDLTATITLTGGTDDTTAPTDGMINTAWDLFKNQNEVNAQLLINAGWATPTIQLKMIEVANARTDARAILDVPEADSATVADMITYRDTLGADDFLGGLYGGWVEIYDQYNDKRVTISPSGDVAANFVNTFENYEMWDSPAGPRRGVIPGALGVTKIFTDGDMAQLIEVGINPVSTVGGVTAVVWSQETLQRMNSALSKFNVVNNVLWIKNSIRDALRPFVHEANTAFNRDNINFLLTRYLEGIQVRGGLYAFNVDTSREINTDQVIDEGRMLVHVYLQPTRTAEVIEADLIITPTGVSLG